jgi:poly-gamma-glutamate synthesis protein (capsule biosynthesis protein)
MTARLLRAVIAALLLPGAAAAQLLFVGDVMLSRLVEREIATSGRSPWHDLSLLPATGPAPLVIGNLEGAVSAEAPATPVCPPGDSLCFAVRPQRLRLVKAAGFTALGLENNHAADLGTTGRLTTRQAVADAGQLPLTLQASPQFLRMGDKSVGLVTLSRVRARDGSFASLDITLAQKLHLAHTLSDAAIAYVHWGTEFAPWPDAAQRDEAGALIHMGADLVVGHHPHVVQAPQCVEGRPVFFSLGNHVFDQKYPASKQGLMASCSWLDSGLSCEGVHTQTPATSTFAQRSAAQPLQVCAAPPHAPLQFGDMQLRARQVGAGAGSSLPGVSGALGGAGTPGTPGVDGGAVGGMPASQPALLHLELWRAGQLLRTEPPRALRRAWPLRLEPGSAPSLLLLEDHPSAIDHRVAPRPYVYAVTAGGLVARWRGSALAYPLEDLSVLPGPGQDSLCALHHNESFLAGPASDRSASTRLTKVYRWNGFGFSADTEPALAAACAEVYAAFVTSPSP